MIICNPLFLLLPTYPSNITPANFISFFFLDSPLSPVSAVHDAWDIETYQRPHPQKE